METARSQHVECKNPASDRVSSRSPSWCTGLRQTGWSGGVSLFLIQKALSSLPPSPVKPRLHHIHVAIYKYPGRATCIRIQVDTCRRDDNFVADIGYMLTATGNTNRYKWIQLVSGLHVSGVNAAFSPHKILYPPSRRGWMHSHYNWSLKRDREALIYQCASTTPHDAVLYSSTNCAQYASRPISV